MPGVIENIATAFILGLLTPITAVCVLPLYPGFLAFLSNQLKTKSAKQVPLWVFGALVTLGVVVFMLLLGLIFTTILQVSLTDVIGIVSPIAFGFLGVISILLILDYDMGKIFPKVQAPLTKHPMLNAFLFGFFFGAIVVPCNPAFIAALFARAVATMGYAENIFSFLSFGLGLGAPLLAFSIVSTAASTKVIGILTKHKTIINRVSGVLMLGVSLYYLIFVFHVFG